MLQLGETASGMFKEDGRGYMIGETPTAGMSSRKTTIQLPSGLFSLYVSVSSNKSRFQGGAGIEGIGIVPHETVPYDAKDLAAGRDPAGFEVTIYFCPPTPEVVERCRESGVTRVLFPCPSLPEAELTPVLDGYAKLQA